jgi:hypothetical protein
VKELDILFVPKELKVELHPIQHLGSDVVEGEEYGESCHDVEEEGASEGYNDELLVLPGTEFQDHHSADDWGNDADHS